MTRQPRGRRFRGDTAKRSKTATNNAPMSNYASASTWDSSSRGSRRLVSRKYDVTLRVDGTQLSESDLTKKKGGTNHEQDRTSGAA